VTIKVLHLWHGFSTRAGDVGEPAPSVSGDCSHGLKTRATDDRAARIAKVLARTALGMIWVYEGLVPKLLFTTPQEVDLVARSGAYWPTPMATLAALGVCEILGGLWLLSGRAEKTAATLSFVLVAILGPVCAVLEPSILYHPFGGLSKNLSLLACAAVVWLLAEKRPRSGKPQVRSDESRPRSDKPQPVSSENEKGVEPCCA
jgi:uncharacterized membrane protein YphA (DoxX/SURF4 family)